MYITNYQDINRKTIAWFNTFNVGVLGSNPNGITPPKALSTKNFHQIKSLKRKAHKGFDMYITPKRLYNQAFSYFKK